MARGRPKKQENLTPYELWEQKKAAKNERKKELWLSLTKDEADALNKMMISAEIIKEAYNSLTHPNYGDVVRFDDAFVEFRYQFYKSEDE